MTGARNASIGEWAARLRRSIFRPPVEGRRRRFVATVLVGATAAGGIPIVAALNSDAISDVRASPGTFWLSGEANDQIVLAAAGGQLASLALPTQTDGAALDVVDTGALVVFQNRSNGKITVVDGIAGTVESDTIDGPVPVDDRPAIVPAGEALFVVDPAHEKATRWGAPVQLGDPHPVAGDTAQVGPFDQWVGTADGRLWALDSATGDLATVSAGQVDHVRFAEAGSDLVLSAVGSDPVVLDRTSGRVRWPRAGASFPVPGFGGTAMIQDPMSSGRCAVVVQPSGAVCIASNGETAALPFAEPLPDLGGVQVFANADNVVVASTQGAELLIGSWRTGTWTRAARADAPSGRRMTADWTPGGLLVDDPGSKFAFTADDGRLTELDKFNVRTVVLSSDGVATGQGLTVDEDPGAPPGGILAELDNPPEGAGPVGGVNRPPEPKPDTATTRVGRKKQLDVLANDSDPNGDPLAIVAVSPVDGPGAVTIVDGSFILFEPTTDQPSKKAEFDYTVTDPGGLTASAHVTVRIIGSNENSDPIAVDDSATVVSGVDVTIPVLSNDTDIEGDPLVVTRVLKPAHGTTTVNENGEVIYRSDPGYVGTDTFQYEIADNYGGTAKGTVTVTVTAPAGNRPPRTQPDRVTVVTGSSAQVAVLANDSDPDGDSLRVVQVAAPPDDSGLTATVLPDQQVSIAAAANAPAALVQLTYQVTDGFNPPVNGTIAVIVTRSEVGNRPPIAVDDSVVVTSTSAKQINLTANDSDPDGDPLTITEVTPVVPAKGSPSGIGTVRIVSASTVEFRPGAGLTGTATFTYTVKDPSGASDVGKVTVQVVAPGSSGPVARDDILTVTSADPVVIDVMQNDFHPDGLPFDLVGSPTYYAGTVVVNPNHTITFTPPSAEPHTYTMSYAIQDQYGRRSSAQIVVTVAAKSARNRPPVAVNDQVSTPFNTATTINVLANDVDPDGDVLDVVGVTQPASGSGSVSITGRQVRYTPPNGFIGLATFTYTVADPSGAEAVGTVVVQVMQPLKLPPIARDDLATIVAGDSQLVDVLANDSDPDGPVSALSVSIAGAVPSSISATVVGNKIRVGTTSATGTFVVNYVITDIDGLTASAKLTVTVSKPANLPPTAKADVATTPNQTPVTIAVLANDTDPEGGPLTLDSFTQATDDVSGAPVGTVSRVANSVRFDPGTSYGGGAVSFSYVVRDDAGNTDTGRVRVTVLPCRDVAPSLTSDAFSVPRGSVTRLDVGQNDGSIVGDFRIVSVNGGTATYLGGGIIEYKAPTTAGVYSVTYQVSNGCAGSRSTTATITVNRPPAASPGTMAIENGGQAVTIKLADLVTDPDAGDVLTYSVAPASPLAVTVSPSGNASVKAAASVAPGTYTFRYTVSDGAANASATVTVTVSQANRPPVPVADSAKTVQGTAVEIDVLSNDSDPDGDALILTDSFANFAGGTFSVSRTPSNKARFLTCDVGTMTFTYWVTDGRNAGATGTVTVEVTPFTNRPPVAAPDGGYTVRSDEVLTIPIADLLANDSDPDYCDAGRLTFGAVTPGSGGSVAVSGGNIVFTPSAEGPATFSYTVKDPQGAVSTPASVSITVTAPPPPTTTTTTTTTTVPPTTPAPGSSSSSSASTP